MKILEKCCFICELTETQGRLCEHSVENQTLNICFACKRILKNVGVHTITTQKKYVARNNSLLLILRKAKRCRQCEIPFYDSHSLSVFCPNCSPKQCADFNIWKTFLKKLVELKVDVTFYQMESQKIDNEVFEEVVQNEFSNLNFYSCLNYICLQLSNKRIIGKTELFDFIEMMKNKYRVNKSVQDILQELLLNYYLRVYEDTFILNNPYFLAMNTIHELSGSQLENCAELFFKHHSIKYKKEFTHPTCVYNQKRNRFDFQFSFGKYEYILELHGAQHYTLVHRMTPTIQDLEDNKLIDKYKKYWAEQNGYKYICIPFWFGVVQTLENILF